MQQTVIDYPEFFSHVQSSEVFPDSKTFPDCKPKFALKSIIGQYDQLKNASNFNLREFVIANFENQIPSAEEFQSDRNEDPENHLKKLWKVLTKSTKIADKNSTYISLPEQFVVPGGRFQEIYYWDSYFTMLGLVQSGEYGLVESMIKNFAYLIDSYGFIPNGSRTYFLSRSQPPFFSLMVDLLETFEFDLKSVDFLPQLEKEYEFWMKNRSVKLKDGEILNRYFDSNPSARPESYIEDIELAEKSKQSNEALFTNIRAACESGWDFSSRWLQDPNDLGTIITSDILPVDLNCLLFHLEKSISKKYKNRNDEKSITYNLLAECRKAAIQKYFWNENEDFFCDYDYKKGDLRNNLTLAGPFPLYFGLATEIQAKLVSYVLESKFLKAGGLITTTTETKQQWDAPNGWAPLQWIAYKGVKNYGYFELADKIKENWITRNEEVFRSSGKFTEKYDVVNNSGDTGGGEYPNQDGFGWTNGVFLALKNEA